ncbi:MAG: tripartite tricarboxylate transporter substrate binding protein [Hydrogenophaga sp.]|uniref:Bug family tripartite tricarboxylate transporter substrate binding protein n=1 Tax=Hydrogenophaga sp. TaxID=1904254 RepID=UPI0025BD9FD4|nr:tripartite tricarboxylate transporter substrate binding protein [Hydrogenophaga sp.]MBT9549970.1 tripartite tricarboxylate transporter substrate binding protein [Hydrogenophaga sp.]
MNLNAEQHGSVTRRWTARAMLALVVSASGMAFAQSDPGYPSRPIKLIVPFVPGGPNDIAARLVAPHLAERLKTSVIVTNIGGAGGRIGSKAVTSAPADGYTIMIGGTNLNVVIPAVFKGLDYDPVKDFVPVGAIATDAMLLAIHPGLPVKNVAEFVQYSKSHPGKVNAGSAPGIGPHFVIELFKLRTGADMTFVPYKGAALAIQDTLGGHLAMTVTNKAVLLPLIQKSQLRALAVTSPSRMADLPDVPTLKESGVLGVPSINWYGLLAPVATPPAVVSRLQSALREVGKLPAVLEGIRKLGLEPEFEEDFGAALSAQRREWAAIAKETRITLE